MITAWITKPVVTPCPQGALRFRYWLRVKAVQLNHFGKTKCPKDGDDKNHIST